MHGILDMKFPFMGVRKELPFILWYNLTEGIFSHCVQAAFSGLNQAFYKHLSTCLYLHLTVYYRTSI